MTTGDVSAIVLAGGRSSRFGRDKLAEPFSGRSLLEHAVDGVRPIAREIVVVTRPGSGESPHGGAILVHDATPFEGPLVGLLTGLRQVTQPVVLVVGGDMPTMIPSVLQALIDRLDGPSVDAVVLEHDGRGRPLPGVLRTAPALAAAERLVAAGERRLRALYDNLTTTVIDEQAWRTLDPDGRTLRDIDTPADLG